MLKIIDAEVMIDGEGFMLRSGKAQMETQSLCQIEMNTMVDCDKFVERNDLRKVVMD